MFGHLTSRQAWAAAGTVVVLAVGGLAAMTVPALAGTHHPTPTPTYSTGKPTVTPTPTQPLPTPTVTETVPPVVTPFGQQDIDINVGTADPDGYVIATGPVSLDIGHLTTLSQVLSFIFQGPNGVDIRHFPLSGARVDRATCSITVSQFDLPWRFGPGTGIYAGVTGSGRYDLEGMWSFPTRGLKYGQPQCSLPRFVNSFNAAWFLNYDPGALGTPTVFDVQVQAVGTSRLASVPVPVPTPTKTRTIYPFAPAT